MSDSIRIPKGDSRTLVFDAIDGSTGNYITAAELATWNIQFWTENFVKNSVDEPLQVYTQAGDGDEMFIKVELLSTETDPTGNDCVRDLLLHYKLSLYKDDNPPLVITGSAGDLVFTEE